MYGAKQVTVSPIAVPLESKQKNVVRASKTVSGDSGDSTQVDSSQLSVPVRTRATKLMKPKPPVQNAVDDLMYGHKRYASSPTAVDVKTRTTNYVKLETSASQSRIEERASEDYTPPSTPVMKSDGNKRLVRSQAMQIKKKVESKEKRYVKPSASVMDDVTNWDAANPVSTTTNPTSVYLGGPFGNKSRAVSHNIYKDTGEKKEVQRR